MAKKKIFNKNFWKFLERFFFFLIISLFIIVAIGSFIDLEAEPGQEEVCIFFC